MLVVRTRTLLAVAAIVLAAGGVAAGGAVATRGRSTPSGPALEVRDAVIRAADLYPTSPANPDPKQVATGVVDLADLDGTTAAAKPVRLVAECDCKAGTVEAQQFQDLVVEIHGDAGRLYAGPLSALDTHVVNAKKTKVKVWLADTGKPQAQGVVTTFSFVATPG